MCSSDLVAFVFFGIRVLELGIWGELGIIMVFPVARIQFN